MKYDIDIKTKHEVLDIDSKAKKLTVKNLETDETFEDTYDKLVLATGARSFIPPVEGIDSEHVFFLRNVQDAIRIKTFIENRKPQTAVIAGTGFIGFEMLENLLAYNIDVIIVEMMEKITPNLDIDMAIYLENILKAKNIKILKGTKIDAVKDNTVLLSNEDTISADMVIMATGVRPNVDLALKAGVELGTTGAIKVETDMSTNVEDIYACGDCIETFSQITGKPVYRPLGSTANKTGRITGDVITGGSLRYQGNLSTGIFKLFDMTIAATGLSEQEAKNEGYDVIVNHNIKPDKPAYFHGEEMVIKGIADRKTGQLLGAQIIGTEGVDKRIDVFATLITYKAKVEELFHLDLAYAPPYSTTKDPVHYTGMILENAIHRGRNVVTAEEVRNSEEDLQIVDARSESDYTMKGHVDKARNMPHAKLREMMKSLNPEKKTVTYCNKGVTGNAAQNILINYGFKDVSNLSGGHKFYKGTKTQ